MSELLSTPQTSDPGVGAVHAAIGEEARSDAGVDVTDIAQRVPHLL